MHTLFNRFFELGLDAVHRYEGTINQFLGDGFMALFGAPIAYEDHARRAVLAALGLQHRLGERHADFGLPPGEDLAVRMGLNTGLVVVGSIGDNLRMDYTAVGDTTNLAARLQQSAPPGVILVSQTTGRLVQDQVYLEAIAPLQVKGMATPVAAYKLLGTPATAVAGSAAGGAHPESVCRPRARPGGAARGVGAGRGRSGAGRRDCRGGRRGQVAVPLRVPPELDGETPDVPRRELPLLWAGHPLSARAGHPAAQLRHHRGGQPRDDHRQGASGSAGGGPGSRGGDALSAAPPGGASRHGRPGRAQP